jgi:hypothetical protein
MGPVAYRAAVPTIRAAARDAARPMPELSARLNVRPSGVSGPLYALTGNASDMLRELRAFIDVGVQDFALHFEPRDPDTLVRAVERFDRDVVRELAS